MDPNEVLRSHRDNPPPRMSWRMADLEKQHGKDIREILQATFNKYGNSKEAADHLGVSTGRFHNWYVRLGLRIESVLLLPNQRLEIGTDDPARTADLGADPE